MNQNELSQTYFDACIRMRFYVTSFYDEFLHNDEGEPINDTEGITKSILELRQAMNIEIDLIREVAKEYNELK